MDAQGLAGSGSQLWLAVHLQWALSKTSELLEWSGIGLESQGPPLIAADSGQDAGGDPEAVIVYNIISRWHLGVQMCIRSSLRLEGMGQMEKG